MSKHVFFGKHGHYHGDAEAETAYDILDSVMRSFSNNYLTYGRSDIPLPLTVNLTDIDLRN